MKSFDIENPKIKERTVVRNDLAFSFLSYMPIVPGHLLICPIRVVESCEDLTHEEWQANYRKKFVMRYRLKIIKIFDESSDD